MNYSKRWAFDFRGLTALSGALHKRNLLALLCLPLFLFVHPAYARYSEAELSSDMAFLEKHLDAYPPQVDSKEQLQKVKQVYARVEKALLKREMVAGKDAKFKTRIGNFFRMGHNLDEKNAWEKSEKYLKEAIEIDPAEYEAYYLLGCLYVGSDVSLAPQAEKLFQIVREKSKGKLEVDALWGLCVAKWMQGKRKQTLELVTEYLKLRPDDEAGLSMKKMAEAGVRNLGE